MTDVVYVIGGGQAGVDDSLPLRWSLRSLAKHASNVGRVIIVGVIPKWLTKEAIVVPTRLTSLGYGSRDKPWNIMYGYVMAVFRLGLDRPFLCSSDDHYFSAPADLDRWPRYFRGELPTKPSGAGWYSRSLVDTRKLLAAHGLSTRRACLHLNTWADPKDVVSGLAFAERYAQRLPYGAEATCVFNAFYEKRAGSEGFVDYPFDSKVFNAADCQAKVDSGRPQFTTAPSAERRSDVIDWMAREYPDPSPWEQS